MFYKVKTADLQNIIRLVMMLYATNETIMTPSSSESIESESIELETIRIKSSSVACDGGGGALGHPRVWLHLGDDDQITCPYCSRHYVLEGSPADKALGA